MEPIHVGVREEHEVFRRGIVACLREDPSVTVVDDPADPDLDLVVASPSAARTERYRCPVLVCGGEWGGVSGGASGAGNRVLGVLPRTTLTAQQLLGGVHAAAAGFHVGLDAGAGEGPLDARARTVLRMLADGLDTRQIALEVACSERTVKQVVIDVREHLGARNRAQAVAEGIRQGII